MKISRATGLLAGLSIVLATAGSAAAENRPAFKALPDCSSLPAGQVASSREGIVDAVSGGNELTPDERGGAWLLLFDGKTTRGWRGFENGAIPGPWRVERGALALAKMNAGESSESRGDIVTDADFDNFELRLQWAVDPGANSGIFFYAREGVAETIYKAAPEMQVLDDTRHEDGALPTHRAGALYDLYAPKCNALKPVGEFNDVRLIVRNGRAEHWLNGYRILEYDLDSHDFRERVATSKFRADKEFARVHRGRLGLQDHGDGVRFRSIRVREF